MVLPRLVAPDFTSLMVVSDVVVDTTPYSSFTITLEALVLGTPVVTLAGPTLRGCVLRRGEPVCVWELLGPVPCTLLPAALAPPTGLVVPCCVSMHVGVSMHVCLSVHVCMPGVSPPRCTARLG